MVKVLTTTAVTIGGGTFPGSVTYPAASLYPGRGSTLAAVAA